MRLTPCLSSVLAIPVCFRRPHSHTRVLFLFLYLNILGFFIAMVTSSIKHTYYKLYSFSCSSLSYKKGFYCIRQWMPSICNFCAYRRSSLLKQKGRFQRFHLFTCYIQAPSLAAITVVITWYD